MMMMKQLSLLLLLVPGDAARISRPRSADRASTRSGKWVVADGARRPSADLFEFHGTFRDFSLWRDRASGPVPESEEGHDTRLWVIEYDAEELLAKEGARAKSKNLNIVFQRGNSLVIEGDVPATLGYDACGGEVDKTVIPVADYEVAVQPMPAADVEKYGRLSRNKDAQTENLIRQVSTPNIEETIRHLAAYGTRHSNSGANGLDPAADWAEAQFAQLGLSVQRHDFQPGGTFQRRITPQIIATLPGTETPDRIVVLGAHLDSIAGSFFTPPTAPGADDNGSGSACILELARVIAENGIKFKATIRFVLFTGEEQGLIGSRRIAEKWKSEGANIIAMLNMDMTGYRRPNTNISVNVMTRNSDANLSSIVAQTATTYFGNEIDVGETSGCCSDQQAFFENGYPAGGIFETPGSSIAYPAYHKETDLPNLLDFEQARYHAMTTLATAMVFAEPSN